MARTTPTPVRKQLGRVRRRLFAQRAVDVLLVTWIVALCCTAVWFIIQPYLIVNAPAWLRWAVLAGSLALASIAALIVAIATRPTPVDAALALDQRFALRERVTTSVCLSAADAAGPAGAALLADANARVAGLHIGDKFPLRLPGSAWFVPLCGLGLGLIALLYNP